MRWLSNILAGGVVGVCEVSCLFLRAVPFGIAVTSRRGFAMSFAGGRGLR